MSEATAGSLGPEQRKGLLRWLLRAVGPIILVVILVHIDLEVTAAAIAQASMLTLAAAYLMFIPSLLLRSSRWRVLMVEPLRPLSWVESLNAYAYAILIGAVTPGRLGELVKVVHLRQRANPLGASLFCVVADRLLDLAVLVLVAFISLSTMTVIENGVAAVVLAVSIGGAVLATLWWGTRGRGYRLTSRLVRFLSPGRWQERATAEYESLCLGARQLRPGRVLFASLLTLLAWAANFSAVFLLARSLGFTIGYLEIASIAAICALVALVPITVMGVGTRDAALIVLLADHGIDEASAIALSALMLSMIVANALLCSFSLCTPAAALDWRPGNLDG